MWFADLVETVFVSVTFDLQQNCLFSCFGNYIWDLNIWTFWMEIKCKKEMDFNKVMLLWNRLTSKYIYSSNLQQCISLEINLTKHHNPWRSQIKIQIYRKLSETSFRQPQERKMHEIVWNGVKLKHIIFVLVWIWLSRILKHTCTALYTGEM